MKRSPLMSAWLGLRAIVFMAGFALITMSMGLFAPLLALIPAKTAYIYLRSWAKISLVWLRITCGIKGVMNGYENFNNDEPAVVLSNHQSTFETMYILAKFPRMSWVIKQELLNIPFFGWGMKQSHPIAIDRSNGLSSFDQILNNGKQRMEEGNSVCLFPEGTRTHPSKKSHFKIGGAKLAIHAGVPVYPVAHNAGECWPREGLIKTPGTVTTHIGPRIDTTGKTAEQVIQEAEDWVNAERAKLPPINS